MYCQSYVFTLRRHKVTHLQNMHLLQHQTLIFLPKGHNVRSSYWPMCSKITFFSDNKRKPLKTFSRALSYIVPVDVIIQSCSNMLLCFFGLCVPQSGGNSELRFCPAGDARWGPKLKRKQNFYISQSCCCGANVGGGKHGSVCSRAVIITAAQSGLNVGRSLAIFIAVQL